jgi:ubiquinone/menaquinone biosynthesis C-methylase UbiE
MPAEPKRSADRDAARETRRRPRVATDSVHGVGDGEHSEVVRREFARQSPSFARSDSFFGMREIGEWIAAHLPLSSEDSVLDVCGGAGHLSRYLSSSAREFVVLDLTREQLQTGREAVARDGIRNLRFVEGDALAIPFANGEFDLAMSRFALHHLTDAASAIAEMARVVRAGGHVAVIDLVAGGARHDELEIMRDPSHTRALHEQEIAQALAAAGCELVARDERRERLPVERWLAQAAPPEDAAAEIRRVLAAEADGGEPTGLGAQRDEHDGSLLITHRWLLAVARRADPHHAG